MIMKIEHIKVRINELINYTKQQMNFDKERLTLLIKSLKILAIIITIDIMLFWFWVNLLDTSPSHSIILIYIVPIIVIVNIAIALMFTFMQKFDFLIAVLFNILIAPFIFLKIYDISEDRYLNNRYDRWLFEYKDSRFRIDTYKEDNTYSIIDKSLYTESAFSGKYYISGEKIIFKTDSSEMIIIDDKLIGFLGTKDTIKLKRIYH